MNRLVPFAPFALLAPLCLLVGACAPDVPQNQPPAAITVEFDPASFVVPAPNDLALDATTGKVVLPISPADSLAQTAFNQKYLGTLSGFPPESTAQALVSGPLDPASVTSQDVLVVDITTPGVPVVVTTVSPVFDPVANAIVVAPPNGRWDRAHRYAVAVIAGSGKVTGAHGEPVIGSPTWGLVSSPNPLVTCPANASGQPDYTSTGCRATVDVIPSTETDPQKRLVDQGQKAAQLELIRLGYAPLLGAVEAMEGLADASHIPSLWTFTIVDAVEAAFDPANAVVPVPNDLAISATTGKIALPVLPTDTPAQTEFNQSYLGSLSAFPQESTAQVLLSGPLDPATVTAGNVLVFDITDPSLPVAVTGLAPASDPAVSAIDVAPPGGAWTRAHKYVVALIAGAGRLTGANGKPLIGSPTWALVASPDPLVTCPNDASGHPDLTSTACRATVNVIPSTEPDPQKRLIAQGQQAAQLEAIRLGYAPLLTGIELAAGVSDASSVPVLWTFTVVDAGEVTFDPADGIVPFPNDVLRSGGQVALPNPLTGQRLAASDCSAPASSTIALYCGLNTLDGFSTTVAPISENGLASGAVAQAVVDATSLTAQSVGLVPVASTAPTEERTTPQFSPCLNCLSSGGQTSPQQLQWSLVAPLDEKTTYLAYVTAGVKDTQGKGVIANPVFALVRSKNPIAVAGKSQVNVLTDAQATQLEPLRAALQPALDGLETAGLPRASLTLAWAFTTQSEATLLDQLYAYAGGATLQALLPQGAVIFTDATAQYMAGAVAAGAPTSAIGKFYSGVFVTPVAVTGPGGTLKVEAPQIKPVTFGLAIPAAAAPAAGYPVTIFGHGITRDRNDFVAIANSLALAGQATIATDVVFHGERSSCTGAGSVVGAGMSDDAVCANPTTMTCNEDPLIGRCVARDPTTRIACPGLGVPGAPYFDATGNLGCQAAPGGQGACVAADGKCEGGDFARYPTGRPFISGWNIFSLSNFFATRDNFRQQVIDLAQLVHTLRVTGPTSIASLAGTTFDLTKMGYVGQSLGGILGTLFNAVSPDTTNVVLNVPGGDVTEIILTAPSFSGEKAALLAGLAAQGIMPGTPAFDQFIGTAQWIVDPADPANMGWRLTHGVAGAPNANRKAFIQFIQGDETVPNITNLALVAAANRQFVDTPPSLNCTGPLTCYEFTDAIDGFDTTSAPLDMRHSFLLAPPSTQPAGLALTAKAQLQAATFLATGALP